MSEVRVRFAPSPTGHFHIGSARTALFNYLYARHHEGDFVLRIEDTDRERNTQEALNVLLDGMRWLGLDWDEGPDKGGDYGPYFQSERSGIYKDYLDKLQSAGKVYEKEGAIWFRLEGERKHVWDERKQKEVEKVDAEPVFFEDAIRGRVERKEDQDFVIFRSDGTPVFHFVNVVDDLTMHISHVIRGEDHLTNTAKHILLFEALGAQAPVFAHIPLILKSNGKGKMSKRDEGALIETYQKRQFLPEAVRNYICMLGWNPKDERELMSRDALIDAFDLDGINSAGAHFDEQKMAYFNTETLRQMPVSNLAWLIRPLLHDSGIDEAAINEDYLQAVIRLCHEKLKSIEGAPAFLSYFFCEDFDVDQKVAQKLMKKGDPLQRLRELKPALETSEQFDVCHVETMIDRVAESCGCKKFDYFPVLRFAVSGQGGGPDLLGLLEVLGKDRVNARCDAMLKSLESGELCATASS